MKNFWKKVSSAVWLQVIAVSCVLFIVNVAAGTSLERVDGGNKQLASSSGQSESSDSLDLDDQSFIESGAFGDWEDFSDFYEDSQPVRPDSSTSSESRSESSSESSSEPSTAPSSDSSSESSVEVAPSEPSSQESSTPSSEPSSQPSSEPSSEPTPESPASGSPIDAPSHTTAPPIPSESADESVPPTE